MYNNYTNQAYSVQSLSCVRLFATPWTAAHQASLSFNISQSLQTHVHWVGDAAAAAKSLQSCPTLCNPMDCSMLGLLVHHQLLECTQTHVSWLVMPSNRLILCCPLLLPPSIFPNNRVFSNESILHISWPKYWSFSFNISPPNEHSGLILRMDWFDLLAVQRTLKSLLQHHSSKASIL